MSCCKTEDSETERFQDRHKNNNRSCTDVICCFIFLGFVAFLLAISGWAYIFGDINKLIKPTNSLGEVCGVTPSVKNKTKLVFYNLFVCINMGPAMLAFGCPTKQICVESCPTNFWSSQINTGSENMICEGDKTGNDMPYKKMSVKYLIDSRLCAEYVLPSISVTNRCIPHFFKLDQFLSAKANVSNSTEPKAILNTVKKYDSLLDINQILIKLLIDFTKWYPAVSVLFGLALFVSLIYLVLLRFFARIMVWISLGVFVLIFVVGTILCFFTYYLIQQQNVDNQYFSWYTLSKFQNDKFWLGMGIAIAIILVVIILILIVWRSQIQLAIDIINYTSESLVHMMGIIIWPVVLFAMQIVIIGGCIILVMQLSTIRDIQGVAADTSNLTNLNTSQIQQVLKSMLNNIPCTPGDNTTQQKICTFVKYGSKTYVYILSFYVLFMFFWLTNFVKAIGQITIAGAFVTIYSGINIPACPVGHAFWHSIRYHMGSLAFGSLILTIVQVIRSVLEYIDQKSRSQQTNIIIIFLMKCLKCCFWCLEKFIKFLNKNAYIMIAIYGRSYCSSAKKAFDLLSSNSGRLIAVDTITVFVLFTGKMVIVGGFGVFSFLFFNGQILKTISPNLFYNYVPVIVVIIGTYIISSMFLQIFEFGVDTIFLCYCEQMESNDDLPEKLSVILGKKNERKKEDQLLEETQA